MKIPTHILMAMSAAVLSAGCLTTTAAIMPRSATPEVATEVPEQATEVEATPEVSLEVLLEEHDPDYCPPCGRG